MKFTSTHVLIAVVIVGICLLVGGKFLSVQQEAVLEGAYKEFAQCIADSKAKFFGAFWCPHCQEQKELFGDAATLLPYTECSTADKQGQTQVCVDAKITGYPTWEFEGGKRINGTLSLETLAKETVCSY